MAEQQAWALNQVRKAAKSRHEEPRRPDEDRAEKQKRDDYAERQRRDSGDQIDPERYRHDPDYRRQAQQTRAYKSTDERKSERENDFRAFIERGGRE